MVAIPGSTPGTPGPTETGGTVGTPVSPVEPPVFDAGAPEPVDPTQPGTKPPVTQNPPPDATGTEPTPTGKPPVTPPKPGDDTHNGGSKGNPEDADAGAGETTTPGNGLEDDQPSNGDDGGCAVAAAPRSGSSSTTWLLGLVGLALLRRRR
jgi:MYXO-CTERM domain-containing protein